MNIPIYKYLNALSASFSCNNSGLCQKTCLNGEILTKTNYLFTLLFVMGAELAVSSFYSSLP